MMEKWLMKDAESSDSDKEMIIQMRSRGESRPALLKTEKPGRSEDLPAR